MLSCNSQYHLISNPPMKWFLFGNSAQHDFVVMTKCAAAQMWFLSSTLIWFIRRFFESILNDTFTIFSESFSFSIIFCLALRGNPLLTKAYTLYSIFDEIHLFLPFNCFVALFLFHFISLHVAIIFCSNRNHLCSNSIAKVYIDICALCFVCVCATYTQLLYSVGVH